MQERSTQSGNSHIYFGGIEDEDDRPSSYKKKGDNRSQNWVLVRVPSGCDYALGSEWGEYDIRLTLKDGGWDDGMVFKDKRTGIEREIHKGRWDVIGQKS